MEEMPKKTEPVEFYVNTYGRQDAFEKHKREAIETAVKKLNNKENFRQILNMIADKRRKAAMEQDKSGDPESTPFGIPRIFWTAKYEKESAGYLIPDKIKQFGGEEDARIALGGSTAIGGNFVHIGGTECRAVFSEMCKKIDDKNFKLFAITNTEVIVRVIDGVCRKLSGYQSLGRLPLVAKPIELTASVFVTEDNSNFGEISGRIGVWIHTDATYIETILFYAAELHGELMKQSDKSEQQRLLAKIAWWVFHAMPYERGSAAICEWYIEAVNKCFELGLGETKKGIDIAAFRLSEDDFVTKFKSFFIEK